MGKEMIADVFFNSNKLMKIDKNVINELKEKAKKSENGKYRLCMQHSSQDNLHEMFIVRRKGDYGRPDKHLHTTESHTIIEGAMLIILFDEDGQIKELFELSKDNYFTYRIDTNIYHMQIPLTEQVVYYEVKLGPFTEQTNIYPEWAPNVEEKDKVMLFMKRLHEKISLYRMKNNV